MLTVSNTANNLLGSRGRFEPGVPFQIPEVLPEVADREIVLPRPRPSSRIGAVPESSQDDRAALPFPTDMPSRIEATIAASDALAAKPRLRQRVEEMLTGILETAEELRRTGQGRSPAPPSRRCAFTSETL